MTGPAGLPDAYREALRAACAAALDAGLFYDTDVQAFVLPRISDADPARDHCLGVFEQPAEFMGYCAWDDDLRARIAAAPRGTWLLRRKFNHASTMSWFSPLMSDGAGDSRWQSDTYDDAPDYRTVYQRMAGYEIYLMRQQIEGERSRARNLALIAERGFRVGAVFRNLRIGAERYSTVTISGLHPRPERDVTVIGADDRGDGWLTLALTRRGSRKRYRADLPARALAHAIDEAGTNRPSDPSGTGARLIDLT